MTIDDSPLTVICFQLPIDNAPAERLDIAMAMMTQAHERHGPGLYVFPEYALNHLCADHCGGTSRIVGPGVTMLESTADAKGGYAAAVLDRQVIIDAQRSYPARRLRRPELYGILTG